MTQSSPSYSARSPLHNLPTVSRAEFRLGDIVRHRLHGFRGVVFDVDPVFANSEEWYAAIPEALRPARNQPFYHLLAENDQGSYVAYVSQQNLVADSSREPVNHPVVDQIFQRGEDGRYRLHGYRWH